METVKEIIQKNMNHHRLRENPTARSLLSQFDTKSNNNATGTNSVRKFSTLSTSSSSSTITSTTTETSESITNIKKEEIQNENIKKTNNGESKSFSTSKIKTITKNALIRRKAQPPKSLFSDNTDKKTLPLVRDVIARPNTLNIPISHDQQFIEAKLIITDALNAWKSKARHNVVPSDRLKELFNDLHFNPSSKQISEILQTAKLFTRKGHSHSNGLTFGEFCVLAADLKRFRSRSIASTPSSPPSSGVFYNVDDDNKINNKSIDSESEISSEDSENKSVICITETSINERKISETTLKTPTPEVFLGGSCNPTTWRADVAIPTLEKLNISFYNPQVSHWTPDLIELEYRAKEKAQVLFFVMDSETRSTAGAIEVAYIAGQNSRQLVLVLHSYRPEQCINNESISAQEYMDLSRNQLLLKEMVQRRGIAVLDNISDGLKRTKQILAGVCNPPTTSISSILIRIGGAFERVFTSISTKNNKTSPNNCSNDSSSNSNSSNSKSNSSCSNSNNSENVYNGSEISLEQCQLALSYMGYAQTFMSLENLKAILFLYREALISNGILSSTVTSSYKNIKNYNDIYITFDEFCLIASHLSLIQQEFYEHGCISPIKGTNITPPPIFLANMQETSSSAADTNDVVELRTSSCNNGKRVLRNRSLNITSMFSSSNISPKKTAVIKDDKVTLQKATNKRHSSRDSGISSPQPSSSSGSVLIQESNTQSSINSSLSSASCNSSLSNFSGLSNSTSTSSSISTKPKFNIINSLIRSSKSNSGGGTDQSNAFNSGNNINYDSAIDDNESDSNDSVFSSGSSVNSYLCENKTSFSSLIGKDFCDVYLGGSCFLRTTWRYKIAIPYLNSKGITYHLPALHESIIPSQKLRRWLSEVSSKSEDDIENYDEKLLLNINNSYNYNNDNLSSLIDDDYCSSNNDNGVNTGLGLAAGNKIGDGNDFLLPQWPNIVRSNLYNPSLLDSSRILLFVITNETRSLAPMTLAAHCIGLMYNVVLCVQMLPENDCYIGNEKLTASAIKDLNRGRSYLIDLAKRQGVPVFDDIKESLECVVDKLKTLNSRNNALQNKFLRIL